MKFFTAIVFIIVLKSSFAGIKLKFIDSYSFSTDRVINNYKLGGISGIIFNSKNNLLYAVSDNYGKHGPSRFYKFFYSLSRGKIIINPLETIITLTEQNDSFPKHKVDFEGVAFFDNNLLISSEGRLSTSKENIPEFLLFSKDGKIKKRIQLPPKFSHSPTSGVRVNLAFESLTQVPNKSNLYFTANEDSLIQDDSMVSPTKGSKLRIIKFSILKNRFDTISEFVYNLSKVPNPTNVSNFKGDNGLVDILALSEDQIITIERSWSPTTKKNAILLFLTKISKLTTDVKDIFSLQDNSDKYVPAQKTLLLNLDKISSQLHDGKGLDNIEAISFGPKLKNGNQTILLASDNNFNKHQRTLFIALEIIPN